METPRVWLITGASSGCGRSMAEFALSKGDIVVATLRKPEALDALVATYSKDRLLVLKVDVSQQADIDRAFAQTKETFGRLDVVFNNAGYTVSGDAESTPIGSAHALFDVNFWGAVNVSRAAVKFFREVNAPGKGGVLLQNSSVASLSTGMPTMSFYCASKHALEGFSDSLAKELLPEWNIKICIIELGGFKTQVISNSAEHPLHPAYVTESSVVVAFRAAVTALFNRLPSGNVNNLAKTLYEMVEGGNIPSRLPLGQDALQVAREKVSGLSKAISDGETWSVGLQGELDLENFPGFKA